MKSKFSSQYYIGSILYYAYIYAIATVEWQLFESCHKTSDNAALERRTQLSSSVGLTSVIWKSGAGMFPRAVVRWLIYSKVGEAVQFTL